jgi:hypothetical protein
MFAAFVEAADVALSESVRNLIDDLRLPGQSPRRDDEDPLSPSLLNLSR